MYGTYEKIPDGCERTVKIAFLSVMNRDAVEFEKALRELNVGVGIRMVCADSEDLESNEDYFRDFLRELRESDILFAMLHGDESHFKKYDRMIEVVDRLDIDMLYEGGLPEANSENRHRFKHSDEDYMLIRQLLGLGGIENLKSAIMWVEKTIGERPDIVVPEPKIDRMDGLFHKGFDKDVTIEEYLKTIDPSKPTIGILTHYHYYQRNKTSPMDALIEYIESNGCNTIPAYSTSSPDTITGAIGSEDAIWKYFMDGDKPRIDVLVIAEGYSQINMNNVDGTENKRNFFLDVNVPVIQAQQMRRPVEEWQDDIIGMSASEIGTSVIWPEYDGQIISVPIAFTRQNEEGEFVAEYVQDRIDRIGSLAISWANLRRKPRSERRVAILLNMYPPTNDRVGGAAGLDTMESVRQCLIRMDKDGYTIDHIPENGNEVVNEILNALTSDTEWVPEEEIESRACDLVGLEQYKEWFDEITEKAQDGIVRSWGDPPGPISTHGDRFIIPGVVNGNVYIGTQPNRGQHEQAETLYHDPRVVMPHQYLAHYRWLKYVFKADIIVHMGTHGTLEWLPGKGNALSADDYPDVVLDTMPNVYPYIIDDPGEGIQCKRRINSVLIGHMCPAMTRAGNYDQLMELEGVLQEYLGSESTMQENKRLMLDQKILELVTELDMMKELGLTKDCDREEIDTKIDLIYDYISDLKDAMIKDGLHILGMVPENERLKEMVYSLCRLRNGSVPSLRSSIAASRGYDLNELLDKPSGISRDGIANGMVVDRIDAEFNRLIDDMYDVGFRKEESLMAAECVFGPLSEDLRTSISHVCDDVYPSILRLSDEMDNYMLAHDGMYVEPGPSGSPTRGNAHLLPTGRNFYSLDPDTIPSESSWRIGKQMADDMIAKYVADNGCYPESIGIVIWATDTMKTGGDDIAYILSLLGVRPTWSTTGSKVTGLEIIPIEELGRPRIDVLPRISGLFRDSFPNLSDLLVKALETIASLDEADDQNYYRKHLLKDMTDYISEGMSPADAMDMASIRVFGDPPGQHGNGVSVLIASSNWDSIDQIAETYTTWGAYAYGGKWKGQKVPQAFKKRVAALDVTVKNHNDREFDMLDIDDDYDSLGGMNAAVRSLGGRDPYSIMGDSSDTDRLKTRTLEEETAYVMRSRVLNPIWAEGLKPHGYKGAMELSKLTEFMLGWSATSGNIEAWMFEKVTEQYILDEEWKHWIEENNPYALREMVEDMLEAADRGLWDAPQDMLDKLKDLYLETEGRMEDNSNRD